MKIRLFTISNLLTLANLLCGALATVQALRYDNLTAAFWLIAASAVFDYFDGMVARLLNQSGPLGVELDSMADDISFGLAPSAVLFVLFGRFNADGLLPEWLGYGCFLFAAAAGLRLAKFNIDEEQHAEFHGLPTPAATLVCVSLGLLSEQTEFVSPAWTLLVVAGLLAVLMICPMPMFALKFKRFGLKDNRLRYAFLAVAGVMVLVLRLYALPAIVALYVLLSLVRMVVRRER